jgi:hypothetical protein
MSQPGPTSDARPDDRRILDELEALQQAIRNSRATRERDEAAFDAQLQVFEAREPVPASGPIVSPAVEPVAPIYVPAVGPLFDDTDPPDATAPPRSRRGLVAGGVAALALASVALSWARSGRTTSAPEPTPVSAPAAARAPEEAARPIPAADPHALRVDVTSLRRVWLRVSVDGRIALEREVGPGEQMPFGADRSIVIRAGDAGAVTVRVGAADQGPLGRDGQVVTRAFTAPGQ